MKQLTLEEIEAGRTEKGGYTRKQLEEWGVPWPPPKGWRAKLLGKKKAEKVPHYTADTLPAWHDRPAVVILDPPYPETHPVRVMRLERKPEPVVEDLSDEISQQFISMFKE